MSNILRNRVLLIILLLLITGAIIGASFKTQSMRHFIGTLFNPDKQVQGTDDEVTLKIINQEEEVEPTEQNKEEEQKGEVESKVKQPETPILAKPKTTTITTKEEKCSDSTVAGYKKQISINKDLLDYAIESATNRLNENNNSCEDDYDYCYSQISQAMVQYDMQHPTCYSSGQCLANKENLRLDMVHACEQTELSCKNTALSKFNSDTYILKYEKEVTKYENLLKECY